MHKIASQNSLLGWTIKKKGGGLPELRKGLAFDLN